MRRDPHIDRFVAAVRDAGPAGVTLAVLAASMYGGVKGSRHRVLNHLYKVRHKRRIPIGRRGSTLYWPGRTPVWRNVEPWVPPPGRGGRPREGFSPLQMKALRVMHQLHDVGGASVYDIDDAVRDGNGSRGSRKNITNQLVPYLVYKGAVIEERIERNDRYFRIVELP